MIYITVPSVPRIRNESGLASLPDIINILAKNGFGVAEFAEEEICIFKKKNMDENNVIPHSDWFKVSRKEFILMLELMREKAAIKDKLDGVLEFYADNGM